MSATAKLYAKTMANAFGSSSSGNSPDVDWLSDNIRIMLMAPTYTPDYANHAFVSDIRANEAAGGTGYTTNGPLLAGKTLVTAGLVTTFDASDPATWVATGAGFATASAVIYDDTPATDAAKPVIACIEFGRTITLAATDTLPLSFNAAGIFTITVS